MVFFGEYQLSFTSPGRLVLPKRIRDLLKGNIFILGKGFDNCLSGYDKEDWEKRAQALFNFSLIEKENLSRQRFLFSSIVYLEIDSQGRFIIPKNLLTYADLKDEALIVGVGDHFEIWNPKKWQEYQKSF
ncbi:MAG: division/cell wall cluster transcriptional repressor MraZ [Patescibacteria group bacterium]|nr:division/cell wall cluster transcriptional repressor MraZ [Patescibacteria group bacterium]